MGLFSVAQSIAWAVFKILECSVAAGVIEIPVCRKPCMGDAATANANVASGEMGAEGCAVNLDCSDGAAGGRPVLSG